MTEWAALSWPEDGLGEAVLALARAAGLPASIDGVPDALRASPRLDPRAAGRWIEAVADAMHVEAEAVECTYVELDGVIASLAPAIVRIAVEGVTRYLTVIDSGRTSLRLLTPSMTTTPLPAAALRELLVDAMAAMPGKRVDGWLAAARIAPKRAARARGELLAYLLADHRIGGMWLLRTDPGSSFARQMRLKKVPGRAALFFAASLAQVALGIVGWLLIGRGALDGVVETGWLYAWILLSLSTVPVQLVASWTGGSLAIDAASAIKQRLLCGALRLDPNEIRSRGSGELLAMVSESDAIETAGLGGALTAFLAFAQLVSAAAVLFAGAGGLLHVALLVVWCGVVGAFVMRAVRRRATWTRQRFAITNAFVENVVGNRTRVAQEPPQQHHIHEDAMLERYLASSRALDATQEIIASLPDRGWIALGLIGLIPAVLAQTATPLSLVIAIGGILQAQAAFVPLLTSLTQLLDASVAWRSIAPLFRAASTFEPRGVPDAALARTPSDARDQGDTRILDARGLSFRYRPDSPAVLRDCDVTLRQGDRILLEGRSGGGKSTLAALLSGLHDPSAGLVLLRGLDRRTIGSTAWRQRVASAPQFHENHILSATLGFNLLMGRQWPPSDDDKREAEAVCRELGLGPVLDKMPSGLNQIVGETGWQLSHGERSRVFLARALLQRSDVVILDESFGALDPITLQTCLDTVLKRAPSLVVIAHP